MPAATLVFLAALLAAMGTAAQTGAPIAVPPVQIGGPSERGATANRPTRAPAQGPAAQAPAVALPGPPPAAAGTCDAGGCWDSQGRRYNSTGDGARLVSPDGRPCQAVGKFIHCN